MPRQKTVSARACSVFNCTNNGRNLNKWANTICPTHNRKQGECCPWPYSLRPFPSSHTSANPEEDRQAWARCIRRTGEDGKLWQPTRNSRVCSVHFPPNHPYPVLQMGHNNVPEKYNVPKREPPSKRHCPEVIRSEDVTVPEVKAQPVNELPDHDYDLDNEWQDCAECENCYRRKKKIENLMTEVTYLKQLLKKQHSKAKFSEKDPVLKSQGKMMVYTGVSRKTFDDLFSCVSESAKTLQYWRGPKRTSMRQGIRHVKSGPKRFLSSKNEMFMALMKIKTGLHMSIIGDFFGVSTTQVSRTCFTWWRFLGKCIGQLIYNPSKEITMMTRPKSFEDPLYRDTRHIIDCTEVFIETPKSLELAAACWSDYKHHHTVKYLISIIPNGHINFISRGYTGRASDNYVTQHSGFIDILEQYDKVLADRGFTVKKLLAEKKFASLVMTTSS